MGEKKLEGDNKPWEKRKKKETGKETLLGAGSIVMSTLPQCMLLLNLTF